MIEFIGLFHKDLVVPVVVGAVIIFISFVWKEWRFLGQLRFYIRVLVGFLTIALISIIILKPLKVKDLDLNHAVLLTENFEEFQLDSLKKRYKGLELLEYSQNNQIIPDSVYVDSLFIIGYGIAEYDFWQLKKTRAKYLKTEDPNGVINLLQNNKLKVGDQLKIQGQYKQGEKGHSILLQGPAGIELDSVTLTNSKIQSFKLKADLKIAGSFLYQLIEKDAEGKEIDRNPIPITVKELEPLQILILNAYPTFETKYLKNFLAEKGHKIVSRIQLTKSKYKFEYFNLPRLPINRISSEILEDFDLVILDYGSLINLSRAEALSLKTAVTGQGLGLFIQPDQKVFTSNNNLIPFKFEYNSTKRTLRDTVKNLNYSRFPFQFGTSVSLRSIQQIDDETISAFERQGLGKIGSSILSNTYAMILEGNVEAYQSLWSNIISEISKVHGSSSEWEFDDALIYQDEPANFKLRTTLTNPTVKSAIGYPIPLKRNIEIPDLWHGTTYPVNAGWQYQVVEQDSTVKFNYFALSPNQWTSLKYTYQIKENLHHFNGRSIQTSPKASKKPLGLFWFYLMAIMGLGYLWLVPKLGNDRF